MTGLVRPVAVVLGVLTIANGVWAFADPRSFYDTVATYPPYNEHLIHDIGAFTIGLGSAIILAFLVRDALLAALSTLAVAFVAHAVSHIMDVDLGGRATDPWGLSALALLVVAAAMLRARTVRARS